MVQENELKWKLGDLAVFERRFFGLAKNGRLFDTLRRHVQYFSGMTDDELAQRLGPALFGRRESYFERTFVFAGPKNTRSTYRMREIIRHGGLHGAADREVLFGRKSPTVLVRGARSREEHEMRIEAPPPNDTLLETLVELGVRTRFVYEEVRKDIRIGDVTISLRTFPFIGDWVEIEGDISAIKKIAASLGFRLKDAVHEGWEDLFRAHCARASIIAQNMVFTEVQK